MQLAKNVIDVGLSTNNLEPMLGSGSRKPLFAFDHVCRFAAGRNNTGTMSKAPSSSSPSRGALAGGSTERLPRLIIAERACKNPTDGRSDGIVFGWYLRI